ncbi:DUF2141 domain-containing protein [Spirosoma sp. KCTC 42546]|uniref:DUF2141 domain-containing protein n=1 Tax=Spirosoma sp. KCTC 42546 TaxID=2520506 RepID=UPI00115AA80C|nr:DUF2141 domain-containing protein [Spirosoma sp. KCTC 42546]QDK83537.1 DUF2141 domain-containing protein [Spirosoma sp. KCTC 42546]
MKTIITTVIIFALLIVNLAKPCLGQQSTTATSTSVGATSVGATYSLTVVIHNVNTRSGKLYVGLGNSKESFTGQSIQQKTIDVPASGEITAVFEGLTPGKYAVRLFQDLNGNQKMDFSGQMPAEPFGFSNVAMMMGPPDFDQSSFDLTENKSIRVRVIEM